MYLVTCAKINEDKDEQYQTETSHTNTYSISKLQLCFTRGINIIK